MNWLTTILQAWLNTLFLGLLLTACSYSDQKQMQKQMMETFTPGLIEKTRAETLAEMKAMKSLITPELMQQCHDYISKPAATLFGTAPARKYGPIQPSLYYSCILRSQKLSKWFNAPDKVIGYIAIPAETNSTLDIVRYSKRCIFELRKGKAVFAGDQREFAEAHIYGPCQHINDATSKQSVKSG
ncbi:MAG: hypothetical protein AAFR90_13385 [Pseudomonadota bacterium]